MGEPREIEALSICLTAHQATFFKAAKLCVMTFPVVNGPRIKSVLVLLLSGLLVSSTSAVAINLNQNASTSLIKVLSDHPGAATALTSKQKSEIRAILAKGKGNRNFICTGISLAGQRESMYRVVLLRAQLVCEYAKSINPSLNTTVKEKIITARKLNGRVEVISR
jgi:hypothetical protein